ncbi:MAG TPA: histidine ammonia-lyase [Anaerolineaceae bacterium]|nr:histidine ammonia-lyase [Anaerolineaceae bacterium]
MANLALNGYSLTLEDLVQAARNPNSQVTLAPEAIPSIQRAADAVAKFVSEGRIAYGITTGFGAFKDRLIPSEDVEKLQENIILSHAVGTGPELPAEVVRAMMIIRANTLAKGHSGIRLETLQLMLALLNKNILPLIPSKGSLGASGDLAPLAHMALPLIGKGEVRFEGEVRNSDEVLRENSLKPIRLGAKEGLALTNGTTLMTAIGALQVYDAQVLLKSANCAAALSLEAQNGTLCAFYPQIHTSRPQSMQAETAANLRELLAGSQFTRPDNSKNVQDAYTLRCVPQVHGAVHSAINYAQNVIEIELNAVTDNPLLFFDENDEVTILSGGNFHGEPLALALDFLSIAMTDLGNISERRIAKLIDNHPEHYPSFLAAHGGLNSGFMLLQYTAAALCSENKTLAHPDSVDSIPSSGNVEDHVSMGANAALHCQQIVENVRTVIAIELMSGAQAIDFRLQYNPGMRLGQGTSKAFQAIREVVPFFEQDDYFKPSMDAVAKLLKHGKFCTL